jgi:PTH1 family peptidyl-tRNA hydrolase
MNLSGQSVQAAMGFYKLAPGDLTVLYDELDLAPGKVRIKTGGGAGGHNGIRSLDAHVGKDYRRVRIGIGHPGVKELVHNHVLSDFAKADHAWLEPLLEAVADNADRLVSGDDSGFMNKVSLALPGAKGPAADPDKPKGQSHIRQARIHQQPQVKLPETGPMAAMLRKLLGRE